MIEIPKEELNKIIEELDNLKIKYGINIIFWCLHGSRGCGREKKNSDYDIGFIYIDKLYRHDFIKETCFGDFIGVELNSLLYMQKKHIVEFNRYENVKWESIFSIEIPSLDYRTLYHWIESPCAFYYNDFFKKSKNSIYGYFYAKDVINYYIVRIEGTMKNFILKNKKPLVVRYLRVIHALLSAQWIIKYETPPPMYFKKLLKVNNDIILVNKLNILLYINYWNLSNVCNEDEYLNNFIKTNTDLVIAKAKLLQIRYDFDFNFFDLLYSECIK